MSTKNIAAVLKWAAQGDPPEELKAAWDELAALSRARAEALEEAAVIASNSAHNCGVAAAGMVTEPNQRAWLKAQEMSADVEQSIRALITTPAPATIPVERLLKAMDTAYMSTRQKHELLTDLGVDLDAEAATPADASHTCAGCRHRIHVPNCCLGDKGECDCGWVP